MSQKTPLFSGSIVALVTPMLDDGTIDFDTIKSLVNWHITKSTSAIVAVGTTGESATLDPDEHTQVIQKCVQAANGRIPIIAGAGANATREAIDLASKAKKVGANATLQVVPYYNKPPQRGLIAHFSAIADSVDLPHILYNVPSRTIVDLDVETTIELAKHPGIVGIKDATGDIERVQTIRKHCGEDFCIISGDDSSSYAFMCAGGDGVISVTANLRPDAMAALCRMFTKENHADPSIKKAAYQLHLALMPTHKGLFIEPSPIPLKWAMAHLGLIPQGIRLPLVPLSKEYRQQIENLASQRVDFS